MSSGESLHEGIFRAPHRTFLGFGGGGVPVKGVSPGGAAHPIAHVYRRDEDGVCTCERAAPEGSLTLDGVPPPGTLLLGAVPEGRRRGWRL